MDAGYQVDAVFLDFSKAFDKVSHVILLQKLCNFGVSVHILNWCRDYLLNRDSDRWSKLRLASYLLRGIPGVPYPPGPLFFVMFINDLPDVVSPGSLVALYADDCKTSRAIQRPCDHESFQDDLNNLVSWSRLNHMSFTAKKWKLMRITEKRSPILAPLQLGDTTLEVTAEFSDLGLLTNHKLS